MAHVPSWGIGTAEAARLLRTSASGARQYLLRNGVEPVYVANACYWNHFTVKSLAGMKPAMVNRIPIGWLTIEEAMKRLELSRCRINLLVRMGKLEERKYHLRGVRGSRVRCCYSAVSIERYICERRDIWNGKHLVRARSLLLDIEVARKKAYKLYCSDMGDDLLKSKISRVFGLLGDVEDYLSWELQKYEEGGEG